MRKIKLIEMYSDSESELNGMSNAIDGIISQREYLADTPITGTDYEDDDAINRARDLKDSEEIHQTRKLKKLVKEYKSHRDEIISIFKDTGIKPSDAVLVKLEMINEFIKEIEKIINVEE